MQILNELMKIKNTPGEGVRLVSKTSYPSSPFSLPLSLTTITGIPGRSGHCLEVSVLTRCQLDWTSYGEISATMR